jgi:hypothetical protein
MLQACATVLLIMGCGWLAGCGSSASSPDADPAVHVSTFTLPDASSGPFDINHRDDAISAATRFAQKSQGHPTTSDPVAIFQTMYLTPQVAGQQVPPPTYGWNITFKATYHQLNEAGSGAMVTDPSNLPHIAGTAIPVPPVVAFKNPTPAAPGEAKKAPNYVTAAPLDNQPRETQKDGVLLIPVRGPSSGPNLYAQPRLPGQDMSGVMSQPAAPHTNTMPPDAHAPGLSRESKQLTVFITVDGSLHLL